MTISTPKSPAKNSAYTSDVFLCVSVQCQEQLLAELATQPAPVQKGIQNLLAQSTATRQDPQTKHTMFYWGDMLWEATQHGVQALMNFLQSKVQPSEFAYVRYGQAHRDTVRLGSLQDPFGLIL